MIKDCVETDLDDMLVVINDGAEAYRGIIPADRWHEPYMDRDELNGEIAAGVVFRGWFDETAGLLGVMGAQPVLDVLLVRHAYIKSDRQRDGLGSALIRDLLATADRRILVGTWAAAVWAVEFYKKHGFGLTTTVDKGRLLRCYWRIPERQIETSVVLIKEL